MGDCRKFPDRYCHSFVFLIIILLSIKAINFLSNQTGKYVVHAKDLPRANTLSCAQRPIKRAEFEKYARKLCRFIWGMGRLCGVVFPNVQIWQGKISSD